MLSPVDGTVLFFIAYRYLGFFLLSLFACQALQQSEEILKERQVQFLDIAHDEISEKNYKKEEDCRSFKSSKTGRGPLSDKNWKDSASPVMCSYKLVTATCGIWGVQSKIEAKVHEVRCLL